jgi:hypothetical protein
MTGPDFDFSHLQIGVRTAKITLYQIADEPYLLVAHAGETNKPYFNSLMKRARNNLRRARARSVDAAALAENRAEDRRLYPKHIIKGWGCVKLGPGQITDSKGNGWAFSEENVQKFLEKLPDWLFDEVREFAAQEMNFTAEEPDQEKPDPEVVSGN